VPALEEVRGDDPDDADDAKGSGDPKEPLAPKKPAEPNVAVEDTDQQKAKKREEFLALLEHRVASQLEGPTRASKHVSESKHYRVLTPVSKKFAEDISHRAELVHAVYKKAFPRIKKPDRKYDVWAYPDETSYLAAGAPEQTLGYYDRLFRRLVIFHDDESPNLVYETLQHEAFHQYLDDYLDLAPSWFNEGLAEYFAAFEYHVKGRREELKPSLNKERLIQMQALLRSRECPPASRLMLMSQSAMYENAHVHYPQSWAMIYFMAHGKSFLERQRSRSSGGRKSGFKFTPDKRKKAPDYMKVLRSYFKALRTKKNFVEAYYSTFGKLDMRQFDMHWRQFVYAAAR
jgi:hypothetical protein